MAKFYAKAPDGSDALLSIVLTGFTQSLQQNGWCKLPNGLLLQWSSRTIMSFGITTDSNSVVINYPLPVLSSVLNCLMSSISGFEDGDISSNEGGCINLFTNDYIEIQLSYARQQISQEVRIYAICMI